MKPTRLVLASVLGLAVLALAGCPSNQQRDTEAPVWYSSNIPAGPADVDTSVAADVFITSMTIESHGKSPTAVLTTEQDAQFTEWVVTPVRSDGGTVASPVWHNYYSFFVPANGSASLSNFRIFPSDDFRQAPLSALLPENGGFDKETGKRNIRQTLHVEVFGKTTAGQSVSVAFDVNLNFFYLSP
jgi:hypothetical protein